jgi:hypothetical protein
LFSKESFQMRRKEPGVLLRACCLAGLGVALVAAPGQAAVLVPEQIEYKSMAIEDPAAKVCRLALALRNDSSGAVVNFQLIVAQMKQQGSPAGPLVTAFTVDSRSMKFRPSRTNRQARLASVAFVSERYNTVALPKAAPFEDGSVAASTLDLAEGRELITAVLRADFELSFTRENTSAADSYKASSPPPADVLSEFSACISSLGSL